jgi:crotonobetainyl-CoA:carnitine CoA-transferase CaiB-like acyl-CoA transferase
MPSIACPVRLDGVEPRLAPAPELGADGEAVLREAGFSAAEIADLRARRVVPGHQPVT